MLIMYTDGSKLETGNCGASWILTTAERAIAKGPTYSSGRCHLGAFSEVYDAELYIIAEGLKYLSNKYWREDLVVSVDNQSALQIFTENNPNNSKYVRDALHLIARKAHRQLRTWGVWTPAHCRIQGNELVDNKAKTAAADTTLNCPSARATRTYLRA